MNTGRSEVINLLKASLPSTVDVIEYQQNVENISKQTLMVVTKDINPTDLHLTWRYGFDLYVMTPLTKTGTSDDELDAFLEDVLDALEGSEIPNNVTWQSATRASFEGKFPAFTVAIQVLMTRVKE